MQLDPKLLEIIVCPQCKGGVAAIDGGRGLHCERCKLKYPVRDGIPIMLVEEASGLRAGQGGREDSNVALPRVTFRVTDGPDNNMSFQLEQWSCRAIGRAAEDPNRTAVFNVDIALALDDQTKELVLQYINRQFKDARGALTQAGERLGQFRRSPDVVLTDTTLSRLHAMVFADDKTAGVLDLVSKNGTFVNDKEVESRMLKRGDRIEIGETTIVFEG